MQIAQPAVLSPNPLPILSVPLLRTTMSSPAGDHDEDIDDYEDDAQVTQKPSPSTSRQKQKVTGASLAFSGLQY